jgi:hypothetical protein
MTKQLLVGYENDYGTTTAAERMCEENMTRVRADPNKCG